MMIFDCFNVYYGALLACHTLAWLLLGQRGSIFIVRIVLRHYELKSCIGGDVMKLTMTIVDSKNSVLKTDTERHEENEALKYFPF